MQNDPDVIPTAEERADGPTSNARIEWTLYALRTREVGHLAGAIKLIEAMRAERDRRRTAMNVLGVIVSMLLEADQESPRSLAMNPMRRVMLENALERAVLALYPEGVLEEEARARAAAHPPLPRSGGPDGAPEGADGPREAADPDDPAAEEPPQDVDHGESGGPVAGGQPGDPRPGAPAEGDD